ncbi:MAG: diguanylate cyclase [Chloroherpetonaceae bacterium]|nr:diguanylate cyclase [Chloroherpetonaceae bacterium]
MNETFHTQSSGQTLASLHKTTISCIAVDDDKSSLAILKRFVEVTHDLELKCQCSSATEALQFLSKETVDLIFLDIEMPDMSGIDLISKLDKKPRVVLITGYTDYAIKAFELQASDYIIKPISYARFLQAVERVRSFRLLERQSYEDSLTKLFNRRYFDATLSEETGRAQRTKRPFSLAMADIDNFKKINDNYSHQIGDEVLAKVAEILFCAFRKMDVVTRYGGEEFGIIFPEITAHEAQTVCERARMLIENYDWHTIAENLKVTISFGIADSVTSIDTLKCADSALYYSKHNGRNLVTVLSDSKHQSIEVPKL